MACGIGIQIRFTAKALDQCGRILMDLGYCMASFADKASGKDARDDAQDFARDIGLAGKQESERKEAH